MKAPVSMLALGAVSAACFGLWMVPRADRATVLASAAGPPTPDEAQLITWREYLRAYWGERWPELETRIASGNAPLLDRLVAPAQVPPWKAVEVELREEALRGWVAYREAWIREFRDGDTELDLDGVGLNPEAKRLSEADHLAVRQILEGFSSELQASAETAFDLLVATETAIWDGELYEACPLISLSTKPVKQPQGDILLLQSFSRSYWTVSYAVDSADNAELAALLIRISAPKHERRQAVADFIRSL